VEKHGHFQRVFILPKTVVFSQPNLFILSKEGASMAEKESVETSEAQIAVHWQEEGYYYPSTKFVAQANMTDETIYERFSLENFPNCFKEYADLLEWYEYWHTILDTSDAPCWKWFVGGKINASHNCIDRHLKKP
jgi:acetyl-CoA synthetase